MQLAPVKQMWALAKGAVQAWIDDYAPSMGAALAYYTLFSIAPLLLIVIGLAGLFFGEQAARGRWWGAAFGGWEALAHLLDIAISFGLMTLLFALGKLAIGLYIGKSSVASAFGAAGSLVVMMVWVYYSAQIFLLGAEFTRLYAHARGSRRGPVAPGAGAGGRVVLSDGGCKRMRTNSRPNPVNLTGGQCGRTRRRLRMRAREIAGRFAMPCAMAMLLAVAHESCAQMYQPAPLAPADASPSSVLNFSPSSSVRALNDEHYRDFQALDLFRAGRRSMDRFDSPALQRPKPWTLYGRFGVFNFQNAFDSQERDGGVRITLRRTGPGLTGRIYIGVHREF